VVVDDELAGSEWEQDLYRLAVADAEVLFETVEHARPRLPEWRAAEERTIVLTRDVATMSRLAEGGALAGEPVNLGGLHHGPGRRELLPYLFVSDAERDELMRLASSGAEVSARDLPDAHRVALATLLRE